MIPLHQIKNVNDIGELVKYRRKQLGLKQKDAAGLLGVGVRFLSELERGKESLSTSLVLQVLAGLNIVINLEIGSHNRGEHDKK